MMKLGKSVSTTLFAVGTLALVSIAACSDNPSSSSEPTVTMQSQLSSSSTSLMKAATGTSAVGVDSVTITRIRMFVRRMKLHRDGTDTTGDKDVKTAPFVITFDNNVKTFASLSIPAGTYDKVKFEFHRPESSQITEYLGIADFVDFVTNGRYSVIYDGAVYMNGSATPLPFTYNSEMTANLSIKLDQAVTFAEGTNTTILMMVDPADVFTKGGEILDPRDARNQNEIDNNIKAAVKVHKK